MSEEKKPTPSTKYSVTFVSIVETIIWCEKNLTKDIIGKLQHLQVAKKLQAEKKNEANCENQKLKNVDIY